MGYVRGAGIHRGGATGIVRTPYLLLRLLLLTAAGLLLSHAQLHAHSAGVLAADGSPRGVCDALYL